MGRAGGPACCAEGPVGGLKGLDAVVVEGVVGTEPADMLARGPVGMALLVLMLAL